MVKTRSGVAYTQSISTPGVTVVTSPSATGQGYHKRWRYADIPRVVVSPSNTGQGTHTRWLSTEPEPPSPTPNRTHQLSSRSVSVASSQQLSTLSSLGEDSASAIFSGESYSSEGSFLGGSLSNLSTLAASGSFSEESEETGFERWFRMHPSGGRYIVGADNDTTEGEQARVGHETPQSQYERMLAEKKMLYEMLDAMPHQVL